MTGHEAAGKLYVLQACEDARKWVANQATYEQAWATCSRGDWMLWLVGKFAGEPWSDGRKPLVLAACECARLALPYTKDPRVLKCIETTEAWTRGEATEKQVRAAAAAADAAADAAAYAAGAAAGSEVLKQCADIVRKHFPVAPELGAI